MQLIRVKSLRTWYEFCIGCRGELSDPCRGPSWLDLLNETLLCSGLIQPYLHRTPHRAWILKNQHGIIGRIMAFHPNQDVGRFGFYRCISDPDAARLLSGAAEAWLRARNAKEIIGPFNPSIHEESGFLLSSTPPIGYGYPDTPLHYINNLEQNGYQQAKRLLTFRQANPSKAIELEERLASLLRPEPNKRLQLIQARWSAFPLHATWLATLINSCWSNNWGFEPITRAEARHLLARILLLLPKGMLCFATLDCQPVGISLGVPDVREMVAQLRPQLGLLNLPQLLIRLKQGRSEHARVALLGVLPEYQRSMQGLSICITMLQHLIKLGLRCGNTTADMGWILEDNQPMLRFLKLYGGEVAMSHVILRKSL